MSELVQTTAFPSRPFHLASLSTFIDTSSKLSNGSERLVKLFVSCLCLFVIHYIRRISDSGGYRLNWTYYSFLHLLSSIGRVSFTAIYLITDIKHIEWLCWIVFATRHYKQTRWQKPSVQVNIWNPFSLSGIRRSEVIIGQVLLFVWFCNITKTTRKQMICRWSCQHCEGSVWPLSSVSVCLSVCGSKRSIISFGSCSGSVNGPT